MLFCMGCGVVQAEQRIKALQGLLGDCTAHLLGLVQNDDGAIGCNHINRPAGAKFIPLGVNDSGFLAFTVFFQRGCKRLGIDDHDIDSGTGREIVQLVQVGAIVDKEPGFLTIMLHEVVSGNLKGFFDTFTDGNRRHYHNKLTPAVTLVQFKHGLDVDIGFTGAGFHFDIKTASAQVLHQTGRLLDIAFVLDLLDVLQQLVIRKLQQLVFVAGIIIQIQCFTKFVSHNHTHLLVGFFSAQIPDVTDFIIVTLPVENTNHRFNRICLILLYFEIEFH